MMSRPSNSLDGSVPIQPPSKASAAPLPSCDFHNVQYGLSLLRIVRTFARKNPSFLRRKERLAGEQRTGR